jgi:hypothetical protein
MNQQASPPTPIKKPGITREDTATAFHHGTRALTRTAAVAALKSLGFGQTAAYAVLLPDGRFSTWLQFAPDALSLSSGKSRVWPFPPICGPTEKPRLSRKLDKRRVRY